MDAKVAQLHELWLYTLNQVQWKEVSIFPISHMQIDVHFKSHTNSGLKLWSKKSVTYMHINMM